MNFFCRPFFQEAETVDCKSILAFSLRSPEANSSGKFYIISSKAFNSYNAFVIYCFKTFSVSYAREFARNRVYPYNFRKPVNG